MGAIDGIDSNETDERKDCHQSTSSVNSETSENLRPATTYGLNFQEAYEISS
jgi:hypothetical protein